MKANDAGRTTDPGFAAFAEALARMEADVESATSLSVAPRPPQAADSGDDDEGFTTVDRQLGMPLTPPVVTKAVAKPERAPEVPHLAAEELWRRARGTGTPLERLIETMQNLLWLQRAVHSGTTRAADRVTQEEVTSVFVDARQLCVDFDLPTARVRADFALAALEENRPDSLGAEIGELVRHLRHDLQSCSIWPIAKGQMWAFSLAPGERARRAFPSAASDVAEGGRCAGFGFHSAAVFHMLRAAGRGMRALSAAVGAEHAAAGPPEWTTIIGLVEARLAEAGRWPAGAARTAATTFYAPVLHDARMLHDAQCRMASGASFDAHHTLAVIDRAQDFLTRLADYVTEHQEQPLTEKDFAAAPKAGPEGGV
ncbi:MAG TPA: hypothetical protein VMO26_11305 [Vicinamibacterales bacterium]|nr:hypothetical protein [Vicinamibacterales bacterium]